MSVITARHRAESAEEAALPALGSTVAGRTVAGRTVAGRTVAGRTVVARTVVGRTVVGRTVVARTVVGRLVPAVLLVLVGGLLAALVLVPRLLGWVPLTVLSGSMEPTIPTGSQVVVSAVEDVESLEIGDVITVMPYPNDSTLVTHRIVGRTDGVDGPAFTTQGDANDVVDPWEVTATQIRGEVQYWVPGAGYVATALSGHTKALGTVIIALSLFGYAALQLVIAVRERREDGE